MTQTQQHEETMQPTGPALGEQRTAQPGKRVRLARQIFLAMAVAFIVCVAAQVFLAGLAIFSSPLYWARHTSFVHIFEFLPLLMLLFSFIGQLPVRLRWLSAGLFALVYAQYFTASIGGLAPYIAAIHPVIALAIFWLSIHVARQARQVR